MKNIADEKQKKLEMAKSSMEEEFKYVEMYRNGNPHVYEKLKELCDSQIWRIVKQYSNCGIPQEDLMQEALIGLLFAIEKYDPAFSVRFATYATYWIREAVLEAINKTGSFIYLPRDIQRKRQKIIRMSNLICLLSGEEATAEQLAESLKMEVDEVEELLKYTVVLKPVEELDGKEVFEGTGSNIVDLLLSTLPSIERKVLQLRYEVAGGVRTFAKVGELLQMTPERARQLEKKALKKLQHPARKRGLEGLW
ncbi:MAG: sigma-70 family RNA polymerase sigma factor [Alphaproteobacteria bacterium]|nr:sigma-70 family RNA polymerase sigma factor [Alphaproteobacteria bacterium]